MSETEDILETARHVTRLTRFQTGLVLRDASEAEQAARDSQRKRVIEQRAKLERLAIQAMSEELRERRKRRGDVLPVIWSPKDNVIPFPINRRFAR